MRAPDGSGDWIIDGQKVWTTGAQFSDYGIVIVRTNPDVPKHKGLTMFWLDLKDPGVEVKPIHQMSGGSGFNEVFFTNVRIPDAQRLGAVFHFEHDVSRVEPGQQPRVAAGGVHAVAANDHHQVQAAQLARQGLHRQCPARRPPRPRPHRCHPRRGLDGPSP